MRTAAVLSLCLSTLATGQVQIDLTVTPEPPLLASQAFGGEGLTIFGLSEHNGNRYMLARLAQTGLSCPTDDPVRIYQLVGDEWVIHDTIDPPFGAFPSAMDIDGDTIVIARSPGFSPLPGAVYVYRLQAGQWQLEAELLQSDPESWDMFANSVAIDADTIVVGAENEGSESTPGFMQPGPGAVYVYRRDNGQWSEIAKLMPDYDDEFVDGVRFGAALDVVESPTRGAVVFAGAPGAEGGKGRGYRFAELNGNPWGGGFYKAQDADIALGVHVAAAKGVAAFSGKTLLHLVGHQTDFDTYHTELYVPIEGGVGLDQLDASENTILLGEAGVNANTGRVRLFRREVGAQWLEIGAQAQPALGDLFGHRVAVGDFHLDRLVAASAPGDDEVGQGSGKIHVFNEEDGTRAHTIVEGRAPFDARLGTSMDIDDQRLIAGLPGAEPCDGVGGLAYIWRRDANAWVREANLSTSDVDADARLGHSVAISGRIAAVGAPQDGPGQRGSVHVFEWINGSWERTGILTPQSNDNLDRFGAALAIESETILVGAPGGLGDGGSTGYAMTFARLDDTWVPLERLAEPEGLGPGAEFGAVVQLDAGRALIGAPGAGDTGKAFVYDGAFTDPGAITTLQPPSLTPMARFGAACALDGDRMLIGAPDDMDVGAVYPFAHDAGTWTPLPPLLGLTPGDAFGASLSLDTNMAAIGAPGVGTVSMALDAGDGWTTFAAVQSPDDPGSAYAETVAINEPYLLVGAPLDDRSETDAGVLIAYTYDYAFSVPPCFEDADATHIETLLADPPVGGDWLGYDVDVTGDAAVVGAPYADVTYLDHLGNEQVDSTGGAAHVFRRVGVDDWAWESQLNLETVDPLRGWFGFSVAADADSIVVGAPAHNGGPLEKGVAHVFTHRPDGWELEVTLLANVDVDNYSQFGFDVAMDADTVVVSTPEIKPIQGEQAAGGAWVYDRLQDHAWTDGELLVAADGAFADKLGTSVAIDGDWIVLGAPERDEFGLHSCGAAYVFKRQDAGWVERQKLIAPDPQQLARLGTSVAVQDGIIAVGAPTADGAMPQSGATYVYRYDPGTDQWHFERKLGPAIVTSNDKFGQSVDIEAGSIVVGAYGATDPDTGRPTGGAMIFSHDGNDWMERDRVHPADGGDLDRYAWSVALEGGNLWVGANQADDNPDNPNDPLFDSGRAYTFDLVCAPTCPADVTGDGVLDIFDFIAFQTLYQQGDAEADCNADGVLSILDFVCFMSAFQMGC